MDSPDPQHGDPAANGRPGPVSVKVVGVGGAGGNIVDGLKLDDLGNVDLAVVNTDAQAMAASPITETFVLGSQVTRGLGTGGDVELGRAAAEGDRDGLANLLGGADLVILVAGLGGGTGSIAAPVIAQVAARSDSLVLAFVTEPFSFEGKRRREIAEQSIGELRQLVHGLVVLPNDVLLQESEEDTGVLNSFAIADRWIGKGVNAVCGMVLKTGLINQDFNSLRSVFQSFGGKTVFGVGSGSGEAFVAKALEDLFLCPLMHLGDRPGHLDRVLVNVTGGADLGIAQVNEVVEAVARHFSFRDDIVLGALIDEERRESIEICVLAKAELERPSSADRQPAEGAAESDRAGERLSGMFEGFGEGEPSEAVAAKSKRAPRRVHSSKLRPKRRRETNQETFDFSAQQEQRGYFDRTDRNLFEGEDLDVPTFLRRGIKIKVKL